MEKILQQFLILCCFISGLSSNYTTPKIDNSLYSNLDSVINANRGLIQQILHRLGNLESDSQKQTEILKELSRSLTRIEVQRQDVVTTIDRSEARISHRLDDIKGDLGKAITLQEVLREDLNKLEQEQIINKVWISEQLRTIGKRDAKSTDSETKPSLNIVNPDIGANLQIVQTTLYSLRRSTTLIEEQINLLTKNISTLSNNTNVIANNSKNYIEGQNFNKAIRNVLEEIKKVEKPNVLIKNSLPESDRALQLPKDCKEVQEKENVKNVSGVYRIKPLGSDEPIFVYCDMTTEGGGWTLIQSRHDGNVDFFRDWFDYKYGFGNIASEFWLGNDNIHRITYQNIYELRIDLEDFEGDKAFAKYNAFAIGSEIENYMIKLLGNYEGDAGDAMSYHIAMQFSTKDNDNDRWVGESCAREHTGGWWYNQCESANLNGQYLAGLSPQEYKGIYWSEWQGPSYSLKKTEIKIRPFVNN
jgi:hypothetical protein